MFVESKTVTKGFSFGKILDKFQSVKSKYVKRFYKIDSIHSEFIQAENDTMKNVSYKALYRDIVKVTKNVVTMPIHTEQEEEVGDDSSDE